MPTIAIVDGVVLMIHLRDHLPPHLHAKIAGFEAQISIATGDVLNGSLPPAKRKRVQDWLATHRGEVAFVWSEIRAGRYAGGMIE
ncbi:DUF4160 domain-containing protein [Blastochloris viridis]|uniref:DUF4160 domain-containing protein n=2 Tax=Blastochloris viridis TaxID=1079 RepID=A0A0P0ITC4_BLAVI|nr:DUF4160 domain-containing protein [Blastochloris viridis]ALK10408.1 hypothetical protein BVIR_2643 [Blastochloris viridis]CUU43070.1 hypothetical protein BVIRIDIS_20870 [Blastochloris viridis]